MTKLKEKTDKLVSRLLEDAIHCIANSGIGGNSPKGVRNFPITHLFSHNRVLGRQALGIV
jgi:hypothetical protein